jgi:hypothetical protein
MCARAFAHDDFYHLPNSPRKFILIGTQSHNMQTGCLTSGWGGLKAKPVTTRSRIKSKSGADPQL